MFEKDCCCKMSIDIMGKAGIYLVILIVLLHISEIVLMDNDEYPLNVETIFVQTNNDILLWSGNVNDFYLKYPYMITKYNFQQAGGLGYTYDAIITI